MQARYFSVIITNHYDIINIFISLKNIFKTNISK